MTSEQSFADTLTVESLLHHCNDLRDQLAAAEQERAVIMENGKMHPFWQTATREEMLNALGFQGAMTNVLLKETDELHAQLTAVEEDRDKWRQSCHNATSQLYDFRTRAERAEEAVRKLADVIASNCDPMDATKEHAKIISPITMAMIEGGDVFTVAMEATS